MFIPIAHFDRWNDVPKVLILVLALLGLFTIDFYGTDWNVVTLSLIRQLGYSDQLRFSVRHLSFFWPPL
jgi:hypothetical protein